MEMRECEYDEIEGEKDAVCKMGIGVIEIYILVFFGFLLDVAYLRGQLL